METLALNTRAKEQGQILKYASYAFREQGVVVLFSGLRGPIATRVNIENMRRLLNRELLQLWKFHSARWKFLVFVGRYDEKAQGSANLLDLK